MNHATTLAIASERDDECGNCRSRKAWVFHYVRLRGIHRILCTNCVLRLHPLSICPSCFAFYDSSPPHTSRRLSCTKCQSFTHTHCAAPNSSAPNSSAPYTCPPCRNPNSFSFFDIKAGNDGVRFIDKKMAEALLCAAKIASSSMCKAVGVARNEAERKVREAALARKRAREALEHAVMLAGKEKTRVIVPQRKEASVEISDSAVSAEIKPKVVSDGPATEQAPPMITKENGVSQKTESCSDLGQVDDNNNNDDGEVGKQSLPMAIVKQEDGASK